MASITYVDLCADLVGTVAGPFAITAGSNDTLSIAIDGGGAQTITLTAGAARTAAQIVTDINATLTGATAYATGAWTNHPQPSRVRIRTTSTNAASSTIVIGSPSHNAASTLGLTVGTATGYARVNATWITVLNTKQELINQIETQLLAAGWTTISGSTTTNLLMQSALSPPGEELQMRVRIKDNSGSCVTVSVLNVAGTVAGANSTTNGAYLIPVATQSWRFIGNKYQFWIHTPTPYGFNSVPTRRFSAFGIPTLPSFLQSGVVAEAIWLSSGSRSDTDTAVSPACFANFLTHYSNSNSANYQTIINGTLVDAATPTAGTAVGALTLMCAAPGAAPVNVATQPATGYRWHDGTANLVTALVGWATTVGGEAMWRGQLWDAFVSSEAYTGDLPITFDSHTYLAMTDNNTPQDTGRDYMRGTLFVAVA